MLIGARDLTHHRDRAGVEIDIRPLQAHALVNGHEVPTVQRLDELLTVLGKRLELSAVPLDTERPAHDVLADQAESMTARLEDGFALASFASQLAGSARQ